MSGKRTMLEVLKTGLQKKPVIRPTERRAGVACILRGKDELEMMFILRATNAGDRWSGQVAFPGGKKDKTDKNIRETAEREVLEEIGLNLHNGYEYLGRIDDRTAGKELSVSCMVYHQTVDETPALVLNDSEISAVGWAKISDFTKEKAKSCVRWPEPFKQGEKKPFVERKMWMALGIFGIDHVAFPAIDLPLTERTNAKDITDDYGFRLWGLTLWMTAHVVAKTGVKKELFSPLPGFHYEGVLGPLNNSFVRGTVALSSVLGLNLNWYSHLQIHAVFALMSVLTAAGGTMYKISKL
eukprot:TRINITY_DN189_c7_g1_i1.p1 TRINITY_DN189_c7_g1~~TRINITY_DN189_c7_g1_i1.p1  ORF type:complete len:310 (+),score=57.38 TRINITY_DN189_c7_g1_i1:42-932(+)